MRRALVFVPALSVLAGVAVWLWAVDPGVAVDVADEAPASPSPSPSPSPPSTVEPSALPMGRIPVADLDDAEAPSAPIEALTDGQIDAVAIRIGLEIHREPSELDCDEGGCTVSYPLDGEDPEHLEALIGDALSDHAGHHSFVWFRDGGDEVLVNLVR